ncbi:MAG: NADH:flavin oxidoreductase/NADH oxidase family protein [Pseudomonadota bacterium]
MAPDSPLFEPLTLPCGIVLKNRIAKSAMSDSLGDGTGHPSAEQATLYRTWAEGGAAVAIIGEVQGTPAYAEKPGNLVLDTAADLDRFRDLAAWGGSNGAQIWPQLGHAGALAHAPISAPKGPSALDLPGLRCAALSVEEIERLPGQFAATARLAQRAGFGGVQIHAAHGFLLSQFLSPLFNRRTDDHGGPIQNRMRLLLQTIGAVRAAVGSAFVIAVKLNATDQLEGGLDQDDALAVVAALQTTSVDLIDISGGTYFPGAKAASDGAGAGPYFLEFAGRARARTGKPLMLTGGFKTRAQAEDAVTSGAVDIVGLARALILQPALPMLWQQGEMARPAFPRFADAPEGGITAWYTMRLTEIGHGSAPDLDADLMASIRAYEARDAARTKTWLSHFAEGCLSPN